VYIQSHAYWKWLEHHKEKNSHNISSQNKTIPEINLNDDYKSAAICPESGCILIRYQVGHGLPFHIDRSPATGSVWLDKGEWEVLKNHNVHNQLHLIFSSSYQLAIASEQAKENLRNQFELSVGEETMEALKLMAAQMAGHPQRQRMLAWLRENSQ